METVFISGKITGDDNYTDKFIDKGFKLLSQGYKVLNPVLCVPKTLDYEKQMNMCFNMIDLADIVYFLKDYKESQGAMREWHYAMAKNKSIIYEVEE